MTLEDKVWEELVRRKRFCTARQISSKLRVPLAAVRVFVVNWALRQILDVKVVNRQTFYRIKP